MTNKYAQVILGDGLISVELKTNVLGVSSAFLIRFDVTILMEASWRSNDNGMIS
jgi:hypothetical protein